MLTLRASAGSIANLTGTLRSLTPELEVLQANASFGNLTQGDTATNAGTPFILRAALTAPIEVPLECLLSLTGTDGFADSIRIPILVGDSMNEPLGPDVYGYRAFDDDDIGYAEHPTYDWVEIRGVGNRLNLGDDDIHTIALPPSFGTLRYYGQTTSKLSICSNGWVAPDTSTRVDFNNIPLPQVYAPQRIIALLWDNFDPTAYGWIGWYHDSTNHRLIVTYDSVPYFPLYDRWEKFQLIIYDSTLRSPSGDNTFTVQYATAHNSGSAGAGIQNHEGTSGLTYYCNRNYPRPSAPIVPGRAVSYVAQTATGIADQDSSRAASPGPLSVAHLTVTPSPVASQSRIFYFLPRSGRVSLGIYDINGRAVRTLFNGFQSAGPHRWEWNAAGLPAGIYFSQLRHIAGQVSTKFVLSP